MAVGNNAVLKIELDGADANSGEPANRLDLSDTASGSVVRGMVINDFESGIYVGGTDTSMAGNFLGTDPSGQPAPLSWPVYPAASYRWQRRVRKPILAGSSSSFMPLRSVTFACGPWPLAPTFERPRANDAFGP